MPRNVRNFWITVDVDGSKKQVATGPKGAGGGFSLVICQREKGDILRAMEVEGRIDDAGRLFLRAYAKPTRNGHEGEPLTVITER